MPISVYIADDHPVYRKGLGRVIEEDPELECAGIASNGEKALADLRDLKPDVAVLDVGMPKMTGVDVLTELGPEAETKIVLLTGTELSDVVYVAMSSGVMGYLLKTIDWADLVVAIKRVYAGETVLATEVMGMLAAQIVRTDDEPKPKLTPRELEILTLVAQGLSTLTISQDLHIERETVKTHLRNTREKLSVRSSAAAVAEALRHNLID